MEKERLRTITILFSKNRYSQITNKNEINEKKKSERKKRKNAIKTFLTCIKKYTVLI